MTEPDTLDRLAELRAMSRAIDADTDRLRTQVRAAHAAGVPIAQIARAVGRDRVTIYRWMDKKGTNQ